MDVLKELYYGRINPSEDGYRNDEARTRLFRNARIAEKTFLEYAHLTAEQEPLFDAMMNAHADLHAHEQLQRFRDGFFFGGRFSAALNGREGDRTENTSDSD